MQFSHRNHLKYNRELLKKQACEFPEIKNRDQVLLYAVTFAALHPSPRKSAHSSQVVPFVKV
ncbi:MAG TPA: hypothetical protein PKM50_00025, partial [Methanoregula sp.]|nr:hypothetical protein [Methanoregula sp.]